MSEEQTHFGYTTVPKSEKTARVGEVFHSVAQSYDLMNDLMSLGIHRLWKRYTVMQGQARTGHQILDIAGGSGDLTRAWAEKVGSSGHVTLLDINASMLACGRDKLTDAGIVQNVSYIQGNAECLPCPNNHFDLISIAFGLRNVTDKHCALQSMHRALKPGGKLLVLEFSQPILPLLNSLYEAYSFSILPKLGEWIANDKESYQYLAESIRMHPNQEDLKSLITQVGFDDCSYNNLSGGIVALHKAYKY